MRRRTNESNNSWLETNDRRGVGVSSSAPAKTFQSTTTWSHMTTQLQNLVDLRSHSSFFPTIKLQRCERVLQLTLKLAINLKLTN